MRMRVEKRGERREEKEEEKESQESGKEHAKNWKQRAGSRREETKEEKLVKSFTDLVARQVKGLSQLLEGNAGCGRLFFYFKKKLKV